MRVRIWEERYRSLTASIDFDQERGIVFGDRAAVRLSQREHQLLLWLFQHPEHYFTPRTLAARAWNQPSLSAEQVRSYVVRLRRLLEKADVGGRIESRRGYGYRLSFESIPSSPPARRRDMSFGPLDLRCRGVGRGRRGRAGRGGSNG